MSEEPNAGEVPCAGIVLIEHGLLLLVQRANPPAAGSWTLPGGRIDAGETGEAAARREMLEECGLEVAVGNPIGTARIEGGGTTYLVTNFTATRRGGELLAGSDAAAVAFVGRLGLDGLELSTGLLEWLTDRGVLERLARR